MLTTIASARYLPARLDEFKGNPLVEALPERLTADELVTYVARLPDFDASQRQWHDHERELATKRLKRCVIPTEAYQKFYSAFYLVLMSGYLNRSPFSPDTVRWMYDLAHNQPVDEQTTADTLLVMGLSGAGKSTMLNSVLSCFPQVIEHKKYEGRAFNQKQLVYIRFDMPSDASRSALCKAFFSAVDKALGTNYHEQYSRPRILIEELQDNIKTICAAHYVGVVIIDEFQNLKVAKAGGDKVILQFFDSLTNLARVPIIKVGTPATLGLFKGLFESGRREGSSGIFELLQLKQRDVEWQALTDVLWNAQWVKKPQPISDEMRELLYQLTQGIPDCLVRLMIHANHEAISSGPSNQGYLASTDKGARAFNQKQLVYIRFDMPSDASRSALCKAFFSAVDKALGTNYHEQYSRPRILIEELQDNIKTICAAHYVGVVIIDEFQNLKVAKAGGDKVILQFFDSLTNLARVPIIKVGTPATLGLFKGLFESGRREGSSGIFELLQLKQRDVEWQALTDVLWNAQWVKKPQPISDEMRELLYQLTQGIPDCLVRLMIHANHEAISSGQETINKALLLKVYKEQFGLLRHALSALRKNNVGAYEDLKSADDWIESKGTKGSVAQLVNLVKAENFTGAAAAEIKQHVDDSMIEYELNNVDKAKLKQLKSMLAAGIEKGNGAQVLEHDPGSDDA